MALTGFSIKTHTVEAQHIRHYPGATRNGDSDIQYLEVKQYIPIDNNGSLDRAVTIIGAHAAAFPKELYEPVWQDLLTQSQQHGFRIRSIWIADASYQGGTGVLNEATQGDDPSWYDYARDMLHMTNVFREHMIQPIVGIGHSIGATTLIQLSLMHPRLFTSLTLVDPIIGFEMRLMGVSLLHMASLKPDLFPSREVAEKIFKKVFKHWDPRTLTRWVRYGLRDTPTLLYPEPGKVTLRTTKASESWNLTRPQFEPPSDDGTLSKTGRIKYPDADPADHPFYQSIITDMYEALPKIQPSVLYVVPGETTVSEEVQKATLSKVGTAVGGSGGVKEGRAAKVTVAGAGHLCMFEKPSECARLISEWLGNDLKEWQHRVDYEIQNRDNRSTPDKLRLSPEWNRQVKAFYEMRSGRVLKSRM